VLAIILLHERPTVIELIGAGVVIAGVLIIGFAGDRDRRRSNPRTHGRQPASRLVGTGVRGPSAGVVYGLVVGVIIAVFTLWDSSAVLVGGMPPVGLYWGSVVFQMVLLAIPALRRPRATIELARANWVSVLLFGILAPLAYMLVLTAIQYAPVSVIAPAREVSVVLVGLAGWLLFKEPHPVQRLIGAAVVLGGIALLALG
jgi:drug/metabolite transporter (DMT)-like permease